MTIQEMNRLRYLSRDIRSDEARLRELKDQRDSVGSMRCGVVDGDSPSGGRSGPGDPTARLAVEISNLEMSIQLDRARKICEEQRLRAYIENVDNAALRVAMKERFIRCRSWSAVARRTNASSAETVYTADAIRMAVSRYIERH